MSAQTVDDILLEEELARKALDRATAGRLLAYLRPYRATIGVVLALEVLWVASVLLGPHLVKIGIDDYIVAGSLEGLWVVCALYAANVLFRLAIVIVQVRGASRSGLGVINDIRRALFGHVQRLSMSYFDRTKEGRIIARIDRDVDALERAIVWGPLELTHCTVSLVMAFGLMLYYDWRISLAVAGLLPLLVIATEVFRRQGIVAYRKVREGQTRITGHLAEAVGGVRVLQAFVREEDDLARLAAIHDRHNANVDRAATIWSAYLPSVGVVYVLATAVILGLGAHLASTGEMAIGEVAAFVMILGWFFGPIEGLGNLYNESLSATTAAERIFLLLDTEPDVVDRPGAIELGRIAGDIRFESVAFAYPTGTGKPVLEGIDIDLPAGSTLALVGHTGAGKSTIVNLLARFYEPTAGRITLDGVDIASVTLASLRRQIGIVPQDGFLFTGTVLDNLRFGRPGVGEDEVVRAARRLGTDEMIAGLPKGYRTEVQERGEGLSHGQRQLIALTRALIADPRLLILDEATSSVDTRTEAVVQRAIDRLRAGRTTVVVAHRLSTIVGADRIVVLEGGRLVEAGTHGQLLAAGGRYRDLYDEFTRS